MPAVESTENCAHDRHQNFEGHFLKTRPTFFFRFDLALSLQARWNGSQREMFGKDKDLEGDWTKPSFNQIQS